MATVVIPVDPDLDKDEGAFNALISEIARKAGVLPPIRHEDDELVVKTEWTEAAEILTAQYPGSYIRV